MILVRVALNVSTSTVMASCANQLLVAVGIITRGDAEVLVSQRKNGLWEFPGGKLEPGESSREALQRELREELGIDVRSAAALFDSHFSYPDVEVQLHVWQVLDYSGAVSSCEGQAIQWRELATLHQLPLLPANYLILDKIAGHLSIPS